MFSLWLYTAYMQAQAAPVDASSLFDWFRTSALAAVVVSFIFGYIIPKATLEDVKSQRDKAQAQVVEQTALIADMKQTIQEAAGTTREAIAVMKDAQATAKESVAVVAEMKKTIKELRDVVTTLDGHRQPARPRTGNSGG